MDTIALMKATTAHPASELQAFQRPTRSFMEWRTEKGEASHITQASPYHQHDPQEGSFRNNPCSPPCHSRLGSYIQSMSCALQNRTEKPLCFEVWKAAHGPLTLAFPQRFTLEINLRLGFILET